MDIGKVDFEAGHYGTELDRILESIQVEKALQQRDIRARSGVETKDLNFLLPLLIQLGYVRSKEINGTTFYIRVVPDTPQQWYTIDEAASHLRLSRRSIYQLIQEGHLASHRVRGEGHQRFKRQDLDSIMEPEDNVRPQEMSAADDPVLAELWDNERDAAYDKI